MQSHSFCQRLFSLDLLSLIVYVFTGGQTVDWSSGWPLHQEDDKATCSRVAAPSLPLLLVTGVFLGDRPDISELAAIYT